MTVRRLLAALLGALFLLAATSGVAAAAPQGSAYLRLAHLSPDTPAVDVYVASAADPGNSFVVPAVTYGAVSDYRSLDPGGYVISMRAAGAAADAPPVISTTLEARPGEAYTIAGTGLNTELGLSVLDDSVAVPPAGRAAVRVVNAAVSAPAVDVAPAGGGSWATGVQFAQATGYQDCPIGTWDVTVSAAGRPAATLAVTLDANSSYTVLLVDRGGALAAELYRDSTGAGVVPAGGVDTGLGGAVSGGLVVQLAVAAVAVLLAGLVLVRRANAGRADR